MKFKRGNKKPAVEAQPDPVELPEPIVLDRPIEYAIACCGLLQDHIDDEEKQLSSVQLEFCCQVIEKRSKKDFFFFSKYVLGFDLMTEQTHKIWADNLMTEFDKRTEKLMRLKPRGLFKTTLYGVCFVLWLWACVSTELKIFYTSSNALLLEEVSDKLSMFLNGRNESIFQLAFGIKKDDEGKLAPKNTGDVFNIVGRSTKGFSLILRTAGGATAGIHPNIVIVDDPCDKNDRESKTVRDKKEHWFDSLTPLLVPFLFKDGSELPIKFLLFIATRWHMNDLMHYIFELNKKTLDWDIEIESIYNSEGTSNYPEVITDEAIAKIKSSISNVFFACQFENNPLPEGLRLFNENCLHYIRYSDLDMMNGQKACFFDPSEGEEKSDWPATIWTNFKDNKLTIFSALNEKMILAELIHYIAYQNKVFGVNVLVFEKSGSSLIKQAFEDAHKAIGHPIRIIEITHHTNKDERITFMQPDLYSGFCSFLIDYEDRYPVMMKQLFEYPANEFDDYPDVIEMSISYYRQDQFVFTRYARCS